MARRSWLTVGALTAAASSGHVLYPGLVALRTRRLTTPDPPDPAQWPAVTVVVAAYHEADCIEDKVHDLRANGYPGELEVVVVADADRETAERAERSGAIVVTADERLGKGQAVNLGVSKVTTPIVVLNDANNVVSPGAIAALVRHFDDDSVGAVAGAKIEADGAGEDLYWRFESWLKRREWAMGTTIGLVGELAAVRTDAWRPIPKDIAIDDLWMALDLAARGFRVAYEARARAYEPPPPTLQHQWERRTRNVAGALYVFARRRAQLGPKGGLVATEIWGHRLGRYTVSPVAHLLLLIMSLRRMRTSRIARLFLAGHVVGLCALARNAADAQRHRAPAAGHRPAPGGDATLTPHRTPPARVANALAQSVFLHAVAIGGLVRFLRGERLTRWPTVRR
jgi:poly-beta-1,6-N-acetyl-D-glucosamine synthase